MTYDIWKVIKEAEIVAGHIESPETVDLTLHEQIVIATWGFGPTYRDRVKYNIEEAYNSGYQRLMKFVIMTDYVSDFTNLKPEIQDMIVGVFDINELRQQDDFSFQFEPIPKNVVDDAEYAKEWRSICDDQHQLMSYGLKRYLLKAIAEHTEYTKILMIDSDVELPYDRLVSGQLDERSFWAHLNTPENTIRGCGYEELRILRTGISTFSGVFELIGSKSMGGTDSVKGLQAATAVMYEYLRAHQRLNEFDPLERMPILEGPVRYFNFSSKERLRSFFNTFNHVMKIFLETRQLYSCNTCGGYILCDYLPLSLTMILEKTNSFHFAGQMYHFRIFHEDRFFGPSWTEYPDCNGKHLYLKEAKSRKEFLEINAEIIECMKKNNQWPSSKWSSG